MLVIDFVVPAHNEEATIGPVVTAIRRSQSAGQVLVVADACTDDTPAAAMEAGATVILIDAHNKGSAMATGLEYVQTPRVGFSDGDLSGLQPAHIDALAATPADTMAVGVRDTTTRLTMFPPIGGERVLPTRVALAADLFGATYMAEMQLAAAARKLGVPTVDVRLRGLRHPGRVYRHPTLWLDLAAGWLTYLGA